MFSLVTNSAGEVTLPANPYVDPSDPRQLVYQYFMALGTQETAEGLFVGRGFLPVYEAQLSVFEHRDLVTEAVMAPLQTGDLTGNGEVNIVDVLALAQHLEGLAHQPYFPQVGDLDGNGVLDETDLDLLIAAIQ